MFTAPYFLTKLVQAWRTARHEQELLLTLLNKPSDHLLRDAGMTREDALKIVGGYHLRSAMLSCVVGENRPISYHQNSALWMQSELDALI